MKRFICLFTFLASILSTAQTAQLRIIIPMQYDSIMGFSEGFSWASDGERWGVIDMENNIVIPFKYDLPGGYCKNGRIHIRSENAFFDTQGNKVFTYEGENASDFSEELAVIIIDDNNYRVVDVSGKEVFKCKNQYPGDGFHDGMLLFCDSDSGLCGYVNKIGEVAIPAQYSFALPFSEEMGVVVNKDDKYGFVNRTGALVIPCTYDLATPFSDGYAWCEQNGSKNFIDKYGKIKIKNRIESKFEGGLAIVKPNNTDPSSYQQFGALIIDKEGVAIFATSDFSQTHRFGSDYFLLSSGNTWSVTDNNGEYITKEVSASIATPQTVNENGIIIIQDPKTEKVGAVQLDDSKKKRARLPGESYAHWVERLASMGLGVK